MYIDIIANLRLYVVCMFEQIMFQQVTGGDKKW